MECSSICQIMLELQPKIGYQYKSSAKLNESILWESVGHLEFIIHKIVHFESSLLNTSQHITAPAYPTPISSRLLHTLSWETWPSLCFMGSSKLPPASEPFLSLKCSLFSSSIPFTLDLSDLVQSCKYDCVKCSEKTVTANAYIALLCIRYSICTSTLHIFIHLILTVTPRNG